MIRLRNSPALLTALDSLTALGLAVASVVWVNHAHVAQNGVASFLRIRITLLNISFAVVFAILWKQCLAFLGLYSRDLRGLRQLVARTAAACVIMTAVLDLYLQARNAPGPIGDVLVRFMVAAFVYELCRIMVSSRQISLHMEEPQRIIILGSGRLASKAWRELRLQHQHDRLLLGFIDDRDPRLMPPDLASRLVGTVDTLPDFLLRNIVDELIVAAPMRSCYDLNQRAVSIAEAAGLRVVCLHDVFALTQQRFSRGRASLFVELVPRNRRCVTAATTKRILDVLGAATGILLLAPVFIVISLAIKLTSAGSVFSVHERHGYGRRCFRMFTFRSGQDDTTTTTPGLATPLSSFLQRTLLNTLPELWNVLLGDMSLVGPQPMSAADVGSFRQAEVLRRFSVRPGVTGNWQVAEPASLSREQTVALDSSYIDDWSLSLDFKILARTVPAILKRAATAL